MKFEIIKYKKNKDKSTKIFPPIHLQPTEICACAFAQCRKPKKISKGSNIKEDDRALPL